jgi:hypothetical protein
MQERGKRERIEAVDPGQFVEFSPSKHPKEVSDDDADHKKVSDNGLG